MNYNLMIHFNVLLDYIVINDDVDYNVVHDDNDDDNYHDDNDNKEDDITADEKGVGFIN